MKKIFSVIPLLVCLSGCGGSDNDGVDSGILMSGLYRGFAELTTNQCSLNFNRRVEYVHSVAQFNGTINLDDGSESYIGRVIGGDGFSVEASGPGNVQTNDGRTCRLTYRIRYESINDDDDRTAEVRLITAGVCSDGSECESILAGDAIRN